MGHGITRGRGYSDDTDPAVQDVAVPKSQSSRFAHFGNTQSIRDSELRLRLPTAGQGSLRAVKQQRHSSALRMSRQTKSRRCCERSDSPQ